MWHDSRHSNPSIDRYGPLGNCGKKVLCCTALSAYGLNNSNVYTNTNPSSFRVTLPERIPNVRAISLSRVELPYSPVFTVVRESVWRTSVTAADSFHQMTQRIVTALGSTPISSSSYVAQINNPAGTVQLVVHDAFAVDFTRTNTDIVSYDIFICTGTMNATTLDDWTITPETTSMAETPNTPFITAANAAVFVRREVYQMAMRLRLNGNVIGRITDSYYSPPPWASYVLYYPNQFITMGGQRYMCVRKHMGLIFATDLSNGYWSAIGSAGNRYTSPVQDAFEVFGFDVSTTSPKTLTDRFTEDHYLTMCEVANLQFVDVEFLGPNGMPFPFPYNIAVRRNTLDDSTTTQERVYAPSTVVVTVHYDKDHVR